MGQLLDDARSLHPTKKQEKEPKNTKNKHYCKGYENGPGEGINFETVLVSEISTWRLYS